MPPRFPVLLFSRFPWRSVFHLFVFISFFPPFLFSIFHFFGVYLHYFKHPLVYEYLSRAIPSLPFWEGVTFFVLVYLSNFRCVRRGLFGFYLSLELIPRFFLCSVFSFFSLVFLSFFLLSCGPLSLSYPLPPQGADVNAKDKDEISGLMEASIMGHVDVVKELLKVTPRCNQCTAPSTAPYIPPNTCCGVFGVCAMPPTTGYHSYPNYKDCLDIEMKTKRCYISVHSIISGMFFLGAPRLTSFVRLFVSHTTISVP